MKLTTALALTTLLLLIFSNALTEEKIDRLKLKKEVILNQIKNSIVKDFKLKDDYELEESEVVKYKDIEETVEVKKDLHKEQGLTGNKKLDKKLLENRLKNQKKHGLKTDKVMTGKEKIQAMMAKNRAKLAERRQREKEEEDENKKLSKHQKWFNERKRSVERLKERSKERIRRMIEEKKKIIAGFKKEKKIYHKEIPKYKKNSLNPSSLTNKEMELIESVLKNKYKTKKIKVKKRVKYVIKEKKKVKYTAIKKIHIVKNALDFPVKNQRMRPTCSSFASIRAIEIVAMQKTNNYQPLSEQYFYWLSKPRCQKSPCSGSRGSVGLYGLKASQESSSPDIPLNKTCPYNSRQVSSNETQTPLKPGCNSGYAKVVNYDLVNAESENELTTALNANSPLIVGMELASNFYRNKGYVFMSDIGKRGATDSHAAGHAMLIIGYMALPKELHAKEGKVCFLTANSWGEGWGSGGHACLSHKWILHNMRKRSYKYFWAVTDVDVKKI